MDGRRWRHTSENPFLRHVHPFDPFKNNHCHRSMRKNNNKKKEPTGNSTICVCVHTAQMSTCLLRVVSHCQRHSPMSTSRDILRNDSKKKKTNRSSSFFSVFNYISVGLCCCCLSKRNRYEAKVQSHRCQPFLSLWHFVIFFFWKEKKKRCEILLVGECSKMQRSEWAETVIHARHFHVLSRKKVGTNPLNSRCSRSNFIAVPC